MSTLMKTVDAIDAYPELSHAQKRVLVRLVRHSWDSKKHIFRKSIRIGRATLAAELGITHANNISRTMTSLIKLGLLDVTRTGRTSVYTINHRLFVDPVSEMSVVSNRVGRSIKSCRQKYQSVSSTIEELEEDSQEEPTDDERASIPSPTDLQRKAIPSPLLAMLNEAFPVSSSAAKRKYLDIADEMHKVGIDPQEIPLRKQVWIDTGHKFPPTANAIWNNWDSLTSADTINWSGQVKAQLAREQPGWKLAPPGGWKASNSHFVNGVLVSNDISYETPDVLNESMAHKRPSLV